MALIDALMAGQQFVSGMQQQQQAAREYRDRMAMLVREEERAMRQEQRQMMSDISAQELQDFEIERARTADKRAEEQFRREGITSRLTQNQLRQALELGNIEIENIRTQAALDAASAEQRKELEDVQRQIIQFQRLATQDPSSVTADMFNAVEQSAYDLVQKYPSFAGSISPLYTSMVDAANFAMQEGRPTQFTKEGAIQTYKQKKTTVGREAGKVGSYGYMLPTGPNLRAGIQSRGLTGAEFVSRSEFESGLRETRMDPSYKQAERTMETFPNFLGMIGAPYAQALMGSVPNE